MEHYRKEQVYRKLNELKEAIQSDSFNLTKNQQMIVEFQLNELKRVLDEEYAKNL